MTPAVVAECTRIVTQEVHRLLRRGVPLELDDGIQQGLLIVLEGALHTIDRPLLRLSVRSRLIDHFVKRPLVKKRHARLVSVSVLTFEDDEDERPFIGALTDSHEADVVDRAALCRVLEQVPVPAARIATRSRQAKNQARARWLRRARAYVGGSP